MNQTDYNERLRRLEEIFAERGFSRREAYLLMPFASGVVLLSQEAGVDQKDLPTVLRTVADYIEFANVKNETEVATRAFEHLSFGEPQ